MTDNNSENTQNQAVTETELKERAVAPRVTLEEMKAAQKQVDFYVHPETCLTICIITLQNGFTVTGESACADPANFQKDIGERISKENAEKKIWPLLGYALRDKLHKQELEPKTFVERMYAEDQQLNTRIRNLDQFISENPAFSTLDENMQSMMKEQLQHMVDYATVLRKRYEMLVNT